MAKDLPNTKPIGHALSKQKPENKSIDALNENKSNRKNKYLIGPGFGLFLMGTTYLIFWLMPFAWESYIKDPRWAHNWAYSIIIMTIGASFYQKSVLSRFIAIIQAFMMPLTASGIFFPKL